MTQAHDETQWPYLSDPARAPRRPRHRLERLGVQVDRLEARWDGTEPVLVVTIAGGRTVRVTYDGVTLIEVDGVEVSDEELATAAGIAPDKGFALHSELTGIRLDLSGTLWERLSPVATAMVQELSDGLNDDRDPGTTG